MKTCIQIRSPTNREDCLAVVQLTAKNFAAEVRGAGQTPEQYIDIETDELFSNTDLWPQIGTHQRSMYACLRLYSRSYGACLGDCFADCFAD